MIGVKTNKVRYRAEVFWYAGILDVRVWNNGVIVDLHVETNMHRNEGEFMRIFAGCKAKVWNVYLISPKSVAFLLNNMTVGISEEYVDRTNFNYGE